MKQLFFKILITMLISMVGTKAFAYDIAVKNEDGQTIYYNYINNGNELEVVGRSMSWVTVSYDQESSYSHTSSKTIHYSKGYENIETLKIPAEVNYGGKILKVTSIGDYVFTYCSVQTSNNNHIETDHYGTSISNLYIPETITHIGKDAFCYWSRRYGYGVKDGRQGYYYFLDKNAYLSCGIIYRINSIQHWIANGGNIAGAYTYRLSNNDCEEITDIVIPENSQVLSENLFKGCYHLKSITLPNDISSIGSGAFDCESLITVISLMKNPIKISSVFSTNTINNGTLYVPQGTKDKYTSTEGWKDFVWIEEGAPAGINNIKQEIPFIDHYYNLNGQENVQSRKGINILKMSNGKTKKVFIK